MTKGITAFGSPAHKQHTLTHYLDSLAVSASKPGQEKSQSESLAYCELACISFQVFLATQFASEYPLQELYKGAMLLLLGKSLALFPSRNCHTPQGRGRGFKSHMGTRPNKDTHERIRGAVDQNKTLGFPQATSRRARNRRHIVKAFMVPSSLHTPLLGLVSHKRKQDCSL